MPKLSDIDQKPEEYMAAVRQFVENPRGMFLIAGKNGNGKSFTARAIFEWYHDPMMDKQFWNQAKLNMHFIKTHNEYGDTSYILQEILKAPLLVLDDIGTRKPSDAFMDFLYWIADQRYENRDTQGTIITTNLNAQSMREIMGDAFTSRVASGICIRHDGPDRRSDKF
jgi:DNA replication protein DnaC